MPNYVTPGVYYERVDASPPAISAIRTDVAGLVGIAPRGPIDTPIPLESWRQFQTHFGGFTGSGFLAYAVRGFFENGGRRCWVVRVASRDPNGGATAAGLTLQSPCGRGVWHIAASSPGTWGNNLSVTIQETHRAQAVTDPKKSKPDFSVVSSTSGFMRGSMVRFSQSSRPIVWKVVSRVDSVNNRLVWVHENTELRLPYDSPLKGFDADRPIVIETVEYTLVVREFGNPIALYGELSLIPEHDNYGPRLLAPLDISAFFEIQETLPSAPNPVVIEELRPVEEVRKDPSVVLEPVFPGTITTLRDIIDPTHIQLASPEGIAPGTVLELSDPLNNNAVVGEPLEVVSIDPASNYTITLGGTGLSAGQQAAEAAAVATGTHLGVRIGFDGFRGQSLKGGADGLALLQAHDFTGEEISPLDSDELKKQKRRGLRGLESVLEVAVVAVPDIHIKPVSIPAKAPPGPCVPDPCLPQEIIRPATPRTPAQIELPPVFSEDDIFRVQAALVHHCEKRKDRIALMEAPLSASQDDELGVGAVRAWRGRFDSKYAAFYYPWLRVVDPLQASSSIVRDIPPTGHVAGQYARTDFEIGVHKAPANAPLVWAQDVTVTVNDAVHGILNPLGINVIRPLPGRGIRIFGARTASSDPSWRYVNVRRLLMMIEKAIDFSTQWAVFEPNDVYTRAKLRLSLTSFLIALWQKGALMGSAAEEAFFVKCDEENNPPRERDKGRLLAEVGVAPSKPFEFIILRVGRTGNEFEIYESPMSMGGG